MLACSFQGRDGSELLNKNDGPTSKRRAANAAINVKNLSQTG